MNEILKFMFHVCHDKISEGIREAKFLLVIVDETIVDETECLLDLIH